MGFLVFELIMRYCDYTTFKKCGSLNRECFRICKKLVPELKRRRLHNLGNGSDVFETFWNGKRQGLCYYLTDSHLKIIDFDENKTIAKFIYNMFTEYLEIDYKRYEALLDFPNQKVIFGKIPGYHRTEFSIRPIHNSDMFF